MELLLSSEVSQDGICDAFYQMVLWKRYQPVRFDWSVTPPAVPGVRPCDGSLVSVHLLWPQWSIVSTSCPQCRELTDVSNVTGWSRLYNTTWWNLSHVIVRHFWRRQKLCQNVSRQDHWGRHKTLFWRKESSISNQDIMNGCHRSNWKNLCICTVNLKFIVKFNFSKWLERSINI